MPAESESFRVTAWLGQPTLAGPWTLGGPMSGRFAWVPFVGVGVAEIANGVVEFRPSRVGRSLWRGSDIAAVELRSSYVRVEEIGPSSLGGNAIYAPFLASWLTRVVFIRDPDHVELQIGVKNRERFLRLLGERGWAVTPYTKTIWPWQRRTAD